MVNPSIRRIVNLCAAVLLLAAPLTEIRAGLTDIANSPLANRRSSDIKPNIMLILDDSGSMTYDAMPDGSANYNAFGPGQRSYLCNTIYYNPNPTDAGVLLKPYLVPPDETGTDLNSSAPATFSAAYDNGFSAYDGLWAGQTANLAADQHYGTGIGTFTSSSQAAYYWNYLGSVAVTPTSGVCALSGDPVVNSAAITGLCAATAVADRSLYWPITAPPSDAACAAANAATPTLVWTRVASAATAANVTGLCAATLASDSGSFVAITTTPSDAACAAANAATPKLIWKKIVVGATSSPISGYDERQRYANWYSYYRTRLQMMKSALGRAFQTLIVTDSSPAGKKQYRTGFITINPQQLDGVNTQSSVYGYDPGAPYNSKFLELRNFDTLSGNTQPNMWFRILYAQRPNGQTPLREGLSRVGRYYAGKNDGPNVGMITADPVNSPSVYSAAHDPVQYACQQNFAILTTDGYWNSPPGSIGGFKLPYTSANNNLANVMDNQDGDITETDAYGQGLAIGARPVFDGTAATTGNVYDALNQYTLAACTWYYKSTNQALKWVKTVSRTTAQTNKTDSQVAQSTAQMKQTTYTSHQRDAQLKQSTQQSQQETWQIFKSTLQVLKSTSQPQASLWQVDRTRYQDYQTTDVVKKVSTQLQSRSRVVTKTTLQTLQTTTITQKTQVVYSATTSSPRQSRVQNLETSTQALQSTDQWLACNGAGLNCVPAQSCTAVLEVRTCQHNVTTDVAVASCSAQTGSSGNSWITITCSNPSATNYSSTPVSSCTAQTGAAGNNWITKTCSNTNYTSQPVQSCTAQTGTAGNGWVTLTCPAAATSNLGNVDPATSCSIAAANGTCTVNGTAPNWINTTYTKATTLSGVSSCPSNQTATAGNSWTAFTCFNWTSTANTPVATSCAAFNSTRAGNLAANTPAGLNNPAITGAYWENTTCSTSADSATINVIDNGSDCSLTPTLGSPNSTSYYKQTATLANSYKAIYCTYPTGSTTANAGWATSGATNWAVPGAGGCTPGAGVDVAADAYGTSPTFTHVQCRSHDITAAPTSAACSNQTGSSGNSWITIACTTGNAYNNSNQIAGPCPTVTNGTNGYNTGAKTAFTGPAGYAGPTGVVWVTTTCNNNVVTEASNTVPRATCGCDTEGYVQATPQSCTVAASAGNSWTRTVCTRTYEGTVPVATCTAGTAATTPYWQTICPGNTTTTNVPVASYAAGCNCSPGAGNTCTDPPTLANNYTTSVCTGTATGPTAVQTCYNAAYLTTAGTTSADPTAGTPTVSQAATAANAWTATTCTFNQTAALAYVGICSSPPFSNPITPNGAGSTAYNAGNSTWYHCTRSTTGDFYGVSTPAIHYVDPTAPNTSCGCTPATNGSCNPAGSGTAGANYLFTNCADVTTRTPIASCSGVAALPTNLNNYTLRTCPNTVYNGINNIAVQTCPSTSGTGALPSAASYASNLGGGIYGGTDVAAGGWNYYTTTCTLNNNSAGTVNPATCGCTIATDNGSCVAIAATAGNSWTTTTCNKTSVLTPLQSGTCTPVTETSGNSWTRTTCPVTTSGPTAINPALCGCTPAANSTCAVAGSSPSTVSGVPVWADTVCTDATSGPTPVGTCTTVATSAAGNTPPWSTTTCDTTSSNLNTSNVATQTCTAVSGAAAVAPEYVTTTCTPVASGKKLQYQTSMQQTPVQYSGGVLVHSDPGVWSAYTAATDMSQCLGSNTDQASWPALLANGRPSPGTVTNPTLASISASCVGTGWPCLVMGGGTAGGSLNSLADVAAYYYKTDLRPAGSTGYNGRDVSANIVPFSATDITEGDMAKWQHMTTFTMGLGVSGQITYNPDYTSKPVGSFTGGVPNEPFQKIRCQGPDNVQFSDPNLCLGWPLPVANSATAVDDLWHAAVNGRGRYFSAGDPSAVFTGLSSALQAIGQQSGAGTAATISNHDPVAGNDLTFRAGFRTVDWTGDIRAQQLYTGTDIALEGTTLPGVIWSAQDKLDGKVGAACDNRSIYMVRMGGTNNLTPFSWNSYACDSSSAPTGSAGTGLNVTEKALFSSTASAYATPFAMNSWSQFIGMTDGSNGVDQRVLAQGANLVNFLRGQRGMEDFASGSSTKLFRKRVHVLGDIIGSPPLYVPPPSEQFADNGYTNFKAVNATRAPMIYAGANDGMVHAFRAGTNAADATGGTEAWAIIPSAVVPNLFRLGDAGYAETHTYFVDGPPAGGDVYDYTQTSPVDCSTTLVPTLAKNCWKTIVVGGLGAGGRGYYALDVTIPSAPKVLWEFNWSNTCYDPSDAGTQESTGYADCHLGLTYGTPMITKLVGGTWVVIVSSGLNNVNSPAKAGDGQGYLYVLNAITGKIMKKITTGVGDASNPSGFAFINAYVENYVQDNTAQRVYGGDMLGNVWRIDLMRLTDPNDLTTIEQHYDIVKLATLLDPSGNPQAITTMPQMMNVGAAKTRMVYVGTGRYLGESDLATTQVQTVYGLSEDLNMHSDSADYIANGNTVLPTGGITLRQKLNQVVLSAVSGDPTTRQAAAPVCAAAANATCAGWYADLPDSGERITVDMRLIMGSLIVPSNVTNLTACDIGGNSWLNVFDPATGGEVPSSPFKAGKYMPGSLTVGLTLIRGQSGVIRAIITKSDDTQEVMTVPTQQAPPLGRRTSWRDLMTDR